VIRGRNSGLSEGVTQMARFGSIDHQAGFNLGARLVSVLRAVAANFALLEPAVRTSAAADYIPVVGDSVIRRTSGSAQTTTIAPNATQAHPIGTILDVIRDGAGALTIVAGAGVTINVIATKTLVVAGDKGVVRLHKLATNVWNASGDLTAV
jgi:hypothetical protein